jgi:type 1 glutamine amidotransferase
VPGAAGTALTIGQSEAEELVKAGKQAMQESDNDPSRSVAAAVCFSQAISYFESIGDIDRVCDLEANIFWCKKRMNSDDVTRFVAHKAGDASITAALAKADAVAAKAIPKSEAKNYFDRAQKYAKDHPRNFEQISVHYFEVAERFAGTDLSLQAQKLSLEAQQQQMKQIKQEKESTRLTLFSKPAIPVSGNHPVPIPAPDAVKAAVSQVRKLYKDDYAKTKPDQKRQLSTKLMEQVPSTKDDPATQYALLCECLELSAGAADWYAILTACEVMSQDFVGVDAKAKKQEVLTRSRGNQTVQAMLKLFENPEDADANLVVGKYLCLDEGEWEAGIPLLAHGTDMELKQDAEMELLKPDGAMQQVEIADHWYDLGHKTFGSTKGQLLSRAGYWYDQALLKLTGITKARIAGRLDELAIAAANDRSSSSARGPFKLLIFSKAIYFRHPSIGPGIDAIKKLGAENGFGVTATDDVSQFSSPGLRPFQVVVFLNTMGTLLSDDQRAVFKSYIEAGNGFVGVHSATDTEHSWPWYGKLIGGYFNDHPDVQKATVHVVDHTSSATAGLPDSFEHVDEWYNFAPLEPDLHFLITLDEKTYKGGTMGANHPVSWYHDFDGGRSFYTEMGHPVECYRDALFLKHLLGGIVYAAGPRYHLVKTQLK